MRGTGPQSDDGAPEEATMAAALSILSFEPEESRAEVVGDIGRHNVGWLVRQLRNLQGNVTLDVRGSRFTDRDARLFLEAYGRELDERGHRLAVRGLPIA
jgi:hypothetical protein